MRAFSQSEKPKESTDDLEVLEEAFKRQTLEDDDDRVLEEAFKRQTLEDDDDPLLQEEFKLFLQKMDQHDTVRRQKMDQHDTVRRHLLQLWICRQIQQQLGLSFEPTDLRALQYSQRLNPAQLMETTGLNLQQLERLGSVSQQWQTFTPTWQQCETLDHCSAVVAGLCVDKEAYAKIFSSTYWGMNAFDVYHLSFQDA